MRDLTCVKSTEKLVNNSTFTHTHTYMENVDNIPLFGTQGYNWDTTYKNYLCLTRTIEDEYPSENKDKSFYEDRVYI